MSKSTALARAVNEVGHEVIYVNILGSVKKFGNNFARALNISSFKEHISFTSIIFQIPLKLGMLSDLTKIFTCCLL